MRGTGVIAMLLLSMLGACTDTRNTSHIEDAVFDRQLGILDLSLALSLSPTQLDALDHGVPLNLEFIVSPNNAQKQTLNLELSYLPMAKRYQLQIEGSAARSFASRLQLLSALDRVRVPLRGSHQGSGRVELRIDTSALPAPMRLPALFDPDWNLATDPVQWTLR